MLPIVVKFDVVVLIFVVPSTRFCVADVIKFNVEPVIVLVGAVIAFDVVALYAFVVPLTVTLPVLPMFVLPVPVLFTFAVAAVAVKVFVPASSVKSCELLLPTVKSRIKLFKFT